MTEIRLRTDKHCIETAAKRTYEKLLKQYFKQQVNTNASQLLEAQIEGLKLFLEEVDAKALRSTYPELDVGGNTEIILQIDPKNQELTLRFKEQSIQVFRKSATDRS